MYAEALARGLLQVNMIHVYETLYGVRVGDNKKHKTKPCHRNHSRAEPSCEPEPLDMARRIGQERVWRSRGRGLRVKRLRCPYVGAKPLLSFNAFK